MSTNVLHFVIILQLKLVSSVTCYVSRATLNSGLILLACSFTEFNIFIDSLCGVMVAMWLFATVLLSDMCDRALGRVVRRVY